MRSLRFLLLPLIVLLLAATAAAADDWTAVRLRGSVLEFVNGAWQPVHRNDVVADETVIRTLASGHVDFTRGTETVSLGPTTQVQIFDKGGAKPFTTVNQAFGTVTVDAEVENVQHFAVETPYLAAVVKGTKFIVTSGTQGASVTVLRGHVEVDDKGNNTHTTISVGQSATVGSSAAGATSGSGGSSSGPLTVSGQGLLPDILDKAGKIVGNGTGLAKGLLNGVAKGLKGLTGGSGNGNDNSGHGNSDGDDGNSDGDGGGGVLGGLGGLLGGLHLRLSYAPDASDADPGLWV